MEVKWNQNIVTLCGTIRQAPVLSHLSHQETFYMMLLESERLSGVSDVIKILCPASLLEDYWPEDGAVITVSGALRSYNNKSGVGNKLVISVLALALQAGGDRPENRVVLRGTLCKNPVYRKTPLGREICDMLLAVNRRYGRADYLPCIAWGAQARYCALCEVGHKLSLEGRIQSRVYHKTENGATHERTAYEISIFQAALIDGDEPADD